LMRGLDGDKMSSSRPSSAIFLSDDENTIRKKVLSAKTGGRVSLEEQRKYGGEPDKCMVYELFLYHLIEDDKEMEDIYRDCREGRLVCGECKRMAIDLLIELLREIRKNRGREEEIRKMVVN